MRQCPCPLQAQAQQKCWRFRSCLASSGRRFGGLNEFNERFFRTGEDVRDRVGLKFLGYLPTIGGKAGKDMSDDARANVKAVTLVGRRKAGANEGEHRRSGIDVLRNAPQRQDRVRRRDGRPGQPGHRCDLAAPRRRQVDDRGKLAGLLAANGAKTLLIDADLRNPGLSRNLGMDPSKG